MFNLTKQEQLAILFILFVVLVGIGVKYYFNNQQTVLVPNQNANGQLANPGSQSTTASTQSIIVHVTGAVNKPGVYHFPSGSRIYDAITTAGDTTQTADVSGLNLAAVIQDGDKIVIPITQSKADSSQMQQANIAQSQAGSVSADPPAFRATPQSRQPGKINVNTASESELDTLPGIGPKLAQRIIAYRQQHGPFKRVDDVILVSGIGPKRLEQIKELITVR